MDESTMTPLARKCLKNEFERDRRDRLWKNRRKPAPPKKNPAAERRQVLEGKMARLEATYPFLRARLRA